MNSLLPGTEVTARGLRWEVVNAANLGAQTLYRLRGLEGALRGEEFDLLHPFEPVEPVIAGSLSRRSVTWWWPRV